MVVAEGAAETNTECFVFDIVFPRVSNLVDEGREGEFKCRKVVSRRFEESVGEFASIISQIVDVHN